MNSKLPELLDQLTIAESQPEGLTDSGFAKLRQEILATLSRGHQIRFNRLSFFATDSVDDFLDDIPF